VKSGFVFPILTLALEQRRIEQRLAELVATTAEFVKRTHALSPDLVAAIQAFGDQHVVEKVAHAVAPLTLLGGESVVEVLSKIFMGTPVSALLTQFWNGTHARDNGGGRAGVCVATELGVRPLQAHCHHGLGQLYGQTGRGEQARAALATAIALYRDMEMIFWLPQAEEALAQME
jgi:hypothetical protein